MIKVKFHSVVDVITNSSTVIYTYQNSVTQAKDLVAEMLKLAGITDKDPDDIFYYGVFCDDDAYLEGNDDLPTDCPKINYDAKWNSEDRKMSQNAQDKWFETLKLSIIKGEIEKPEWMSNCETDQYGDSWNPNSYLNLIPKEEKYAEFGNKIKALLGSVSADGGRDG